MRQSLMTKITTKITSQSQSRRLSQRPDGGVGYSSTVRALYVRISHNNSTAIPLQCRVISDCADMKVVKMLEYGHS